MTKPRNRWIGLVFISMAISLVIIDGTIVNTIFPKVIEALGLTSTQIQWVQESYVLVFASLLLVWGSLADRVGRKRLLIIGITIFVAASVWAGFSNDANAMILARVLQGVGGSMVLPTTLSLVNANFQGKERGAAFAVWGATIGGMVAVGPVLGGWLATSFGDDGWRLAFNINLPLGALVIAGLAWWVAESKQEQREGGIDYVGAGISVIMFLTLVFGLIEGRVYGWWEVTKNQFVIGDFAWPTEGISIIPVSLAISALSFVLFVLWEKRRERAHKNVILDLDLFKIRSFRNGSIAALIISMGEFGILFAIPLWLQSVQGLSPVDSGLVLLWLAGGAFIASGISGGMSGKIRPVTAVRAGAVLETIAVAGIAIVATPDATWGSFAPFLLLYGLGIGLATAQLTGVIMIDVPMEKNGQGSGSQSTVRQIGSALGIAVLGTFLFSITSSSVDANLEKVTTPPSGFYLPVDPANPMGDKIPLTDAVVDSAGGVIPAIENIYGKEVQTAAADGFTSGVSGSAWAAAGFLALGAISTIGLGSAADRKKKAEKKA
jgi:EmrB/QacA subfamily drug resistance transporter